MSWVMIGLVLLVGALVMWEWRKNEVFEPWLPISEHRSGMVIPMPPCKTPMGRRDLTPEMLGKPITYAGMSYEQARRILTAATNTEGDGI